MEKIENKCTHHWIIPNNGEIVTETCKKCGEKRDFANTVYSATKNKRELNGVN